jgi:hypothetical protein
MWCTVKWYIFIAHSVYQISRWPHADQIFISFLRHIKRRAGLHPNIIAFDHYAPTQVPAVRTKFVSKIVVTFDRSGQHPACIMENKRCDASSRVSTNPKLANPGVRYSALSCTSVFTSTLSWFIHVLAWQNTSLTYAISKRYRTARALCTEIKRKANENGCPHRFTSLQHRDRGLEYCSRYRYGQQLAVQDGIKTTVPSWVSGAAGNSGRYSDGSRCTFRNTLHCFGY